jgi:hypothetical protein
MRIISYTVLGATLFCAQAFSQEPMRPNGVKEKIMFATNICMSKGGIGVITKNLHIDLKSTKNELILGTRERWTGQAVQTSEVVIFFEGKIWSLQALPDGFDLSKAVIVSFENDKVRFLDFSKLSGGYYRRVGVGHP